MRNQITSNSTDQRYRDEGIELEECLAYVKKEEIKLEECPAYGQHPVKGTLI